MIAHRTAVLTLLVLLLSLACAGPSSAPEDRGPPCGADEDPPAAAGDDAAPGDDADDEEEDDDETPYGDVVTDEAETQEGLFLVHEVDDKLYFEIPNELLGRDMLLVSRIARVPAGLAGGFIAAGHKTGEQVLRWERHDDRVLLRKVSFRDVADEESAIHRSVVNNNFFPILAAFDIETEGPPEPEDEEPDEDESAADQDRAPSDEAEASEGARGEDESGGARSTGAQGGAGHPQEDDSADAHQAEGHDDAGASQGEGGDADQEAEREEHEKTTVVLDVTGFFEKDVPAISGLSRSLREAHKIGGLDGDRTFISAAHAFPRNIEVRTVMTFRASEPPTDAATKTLSLEMNQSMVLLPEEPMRRRFADDRVGWFTTSRTNYALDEQKAASEEFIQRWRLEPADPEAYARGELVEPVQPIVYYLDPGTPEKWAPYVKQGVEDWQAAFESAGFRNAILARDPPDPEDDPTWSGEDVRHSMVRWAASTFRNAMGPSVTDPRSGEIIESDIVWYHNHMRSYRNRLLLETGAANPLARSLPVDDELLGEALRQVIAHEVGHALGLPHNMIASSSYPVESLRDPAFCAEHGVSASIMDYARQNYVAQPGDGLEGSDFIRRIGAYDHYAIEWGYRAIPEAATAEDEKPVLDGWITAKADDPMYRFGSATGLDPRAQTEDLGDDPVAASGYGLANLKRVAPQLIEWTRAPGEDYGDLAELYGELVGMYGRYMGHVVTVLGGVYSDRKAADQAGRLHRPVPGDTQREAMAFLAEHALATPSWLIDPEILRRIAPAGDVDRVRSMQTRTLRGMLDAARLQRMVEAQLELGGEAYPLPEYLDDLTEAVWADLTSPYARALQREHLTQLERLATGDASGFTSAVDVDTSDLPALASFQLVNLPARVQPHVSDPDVAVKAHALHVQNRIAAFLDGRIRD